MLKKRFGMGTYLGVAVTILLLLPAGICWGQCTYGRLMKKGELDFEGSVIPYKIYKYVPPLIMPNKYYFSPDEVDLNTPEQNINAIESARQRDTNWYLSLLDEPGRKLELKLNRKTNGRVLEEKLKGTPYGDPLEDGKYFKLLYKVYYTDNKVKRCLMLYHIYIDDEILGGKGSMTFMHFIFKNKKWFESFMVSPNKYEERGDKLKFLFYRMIQKEIKSKKAGKDQD